MRSEMSLRIPVTLTSRTSPVTGGAALGAAPGCAAATSRSMMRPPGPVPRSPASWTPLEAASAFARGEALIFPSVGAGAAGAAGGGGAAGAGGAAAAGPPAPLSASAFSPGFPMAAIGASTGTSAPCSWKIARSVPSAGDSTSNVALSVSTSQRMSPAFTASPACFFQLTMMHDSTD